MGVASNDQPRYAGELFDELGIPYHDHFLDELERKAARGITESAALDAYLDGTAYVDREQGSIVFRGATGVAVAVDRDTGWVRTVFRGTRQGVGTRWLWLGTARDVRTANAWPPTL